MQESPVPVETGSTLLTLHHSIYQNSEKIIFFKRMWRLESVYIAEKCLISADVQKYC